ncbi:Unconventional myosin-IXa [Holothuria leucospilota]|uniref:Unconventional myosin-IXa n=1 Tax=Holothuria leucospilota TaxID=206669 RepID=A0A9Q1BMK8_HOLLE|nr:Unconventional myosin-IXa [Holothuria leucospilota]
MAFVRELVGADPLAVFRWAIVRAFFRARSAFVAAGERLRSQGKNPVRKLNSLTNVQNDENIQKNDSSLHVSHAYRRNSKENQKSSGSSAGSSAGSKSRKKLALLSPGGLYDETYAKARKVLKKNRSFRGAQSQPAKTLRDLNSMRRLAGDKMSGMRRQSQKKTQTVSIQFQNSLNRLMETLNQANPFFVRCIKSNSEKEPCKLDEKLVMRQLKYTGMLETVRIRQSGYNVRLTFEEFCHRYKLLLTKGLDSSVEDIKEFLISMELDQKHYQIGKTKVFLRESERIKLQDALHFKVLEKIILLQWWVRGVLQRKRYLQQLNTIIAIQAHAKGYLVRKQIQEQREQEERLLAAIFIQNYWRTFCFQRNFMKLRRGALHLQCHIRGHLARKDLARLKEEREKKRLEEEEEQRHLQEEELDKTIVPCIEPLKGGQEEVRSSASDEGILTPDEFEDDDDDHRKRTRTMESEESSGILDGSLGSDELLLDDPSPQASSSCSTQPDVIIVDDDHEQETPQESLMFQRSQQPRVKERIKTFQNLISERRHTTGSSHSPKATHKWYIEKPELPHKPYSTPVTNDDILKLYHEDTEEHEEEKEKQQEKKDDEKKDVEKGQEMDQEMDQEEKEGEEEKSPEKLPEVPHPHVKLKRAEAFKIVKANSTEAPEPPSSPKVKPKRPHSSYSQKSIPDDIEVAPLLEPLSPTIESPPVSPSEPKKAQGHFQKAKERFKKHFRKRTGEITEQQRLEAEMTLTDGGSVSKNKRRSSAESPAPKKSNMNIHSRSQWRYPTNQLISDATELGNMNNFLLTKIDEVKATTDTEGSADQVFKEALKEFRSNLMNMCSVAMQNEGALNLKYTDLVSYFEKALENKAKKLSNNSQFPVTLGINAFQGFLNEYMQVHKPSNNSKKENRKPKPKKTEDVFAYCGHEYVTSQFTIPTACEYCHNFLWLMEKGYVCQVCNFTAHKKCATKALEHCKGKPQEKVKGRVIGAHLTSVVTEESTVPPVVERCITCVELNGIYTEGIYRRAGSAAKVKELKHKINTEENIDNIDLNSYNVLCVAQVLKCFFRELPEPLLTYDLYEEFLRATEIQGKRAQLLSLQDTLEKLPTVNHDIFERLIFHLARIACHEDSNKMSPNALAIVFSPCVLKSKVQTSPWDSLQDVSKQAECLELIIKEKMNKLQTMLRDISTLERASTTASLKLSEVRKSRAHKLEMRVVECDEDLASDVNSTGQTSSEGSQELEIALAEQIRTLEKEKQDLTANLQSLDLLLAGSEEDNYSVDELDNSSIDDLDSLSNSGETPVSFELPPSRSMLPHLNKDRAPRQQKRPPARYSKAYLLDTPPTTPETGAKIQKRNSKGKGNLV